ncbi:MAG: tetratricopeptide repeat protein [Deltaproteobacteria bacterium]|nr:tetratricopeptide repeat protein [Deltaproteobacteria bacterium]
MPPPRAAAQAPPPAPRVEAWSEPAPVREAPRARRSSPAVFFGLLLVFGGAVSAYWVLGQRSAREKREVKKLLDQASEHLRHDAYDAYVGACKAAEEALDIRPDSGVAHGYLAYAWAIRWGEHGGGDEARNQAEEHLEAARQSGEESSYLYAAEALFAAWSGKGGEARGTLEERVKAFDAQGRASATLYLTLGLVQLRAGDLARAKESLDRAQVLAPSDARVYAALANLYRRRGQDAQATQNFAYALRYEPGHPESVLGWTLLELDKDAPDYARVAATLKRLLEQQPPPSPRQLAGAHLARALLVGRVSGELSGLKPEAAKALAEATGVARDAAKAAVDVQSEEQAGFDADKGNPELRLVKAKRLRFAKDVDGAVAELREAIAADPTRAQFHVELALALREKQGGEQEVVDALNTALQAMGDSPRLTVLLGDTLRRQGKLDEAVAQYEQALAGPGKNPDARLSLGVAHRMKKDTAKSLETLDKAAQEFVGNDVKVAECQLETARTHEAVEDMPRADAAYQKALTTDPNLADGYYWYGRFLMKDKKMQGKGRDLFQKYLEMEPRGRYVAEAEKFVKEWDPEKER